MAFHVFHINEVFSNADGTVQYIEFVGEANGQDVWGGHSIVSTSGANTNTFDILTDLPNNQTLGKSVLLATQGFANLGLVTPDYIIPNGFLFLSGGNVDFPGMNEGTLSYTRLPINGTLSLNDIGVSAINSPTNFAGVTATIPGNPIVGSNGANDIKGTWGSDFINGFLGADTMSGGGGNDIYIVNYALDVVREIPLFPVNTNTAIQLVSNTGSGVIGNGHSGENAVTISGNGNLVGFYSRANNLFAPDANQHDEFDVKNMTTGSVITAHTNAANVPPTSGQGGEPDNGYSAIHMTPDGRYVVFSSSSVGLIPADTTTDGDIFVKDLQTGALTIESQPTGTGVQGLHSSAPDLSDNGRFVVFTSTNNLVSAPDSNTTDSDVYWRDRQTGELRMVSGEFDGSDQGNSDSADATVTNDGRFVLFESAASNFTALGFDTLGHIDLFVRDMVSDTVQLIIGAADNVNLANGSSTDGNITPDGKYAVYTSSASNLIVGDTNGSADIFRQDLTTGAVIRVSTSATGVQAGHPSQHAQITPDGRYVVFESRATNLVTVTGDSNALTKVFVKDLVTGGIEMVSRTATGGALTLNSAFAPQISDDGQFIAFNTRTALNPGDSGTIEDVYRVPNPLYSPADEIRASVSYTLPDGVENLTLTGTTAINGTGNTLGNVLTGNSGSNTLSGGGGNDTLNGGAGADTMIGGSGNDIYMVNSTLDVVTEASSAGTDLVQSTAGGHTLSVNVEKLTLTGTGNINGTGNTGNNVLTGNKGNNILTGSSGNDTLAGALGNDTLNGGAGADAYLFNSAPGAANIDQVTAYSVADDTIRLENAIFTSLTGTGALSAARFRAGAGFTAAADANDFIIYNTTTGQLFYDAGGNTGAASKLFATLVGHPGGLTAAEFVIV